jgi:hypothetical protein
MTKGLILRGLGIVLMLLSMIAANFMHDYARGSYCMAWAILCFVWTPTRAREREADNAK